ncbi:hypothetical protein AQUCO_01800138v1 [Aquilegia coerulea]|uniref:EF-hand domain-containing protein n=1 Tax=Aquilegia coerulea TaxID=218851 RepID=A0A2G5DK54_AQUCA|nr:hypothetical protein AQUCO_01800138v1 [Aquilegia coerulea]
MIDIVGFGSRFIGDLIRLFNKDTQSISDCSVCPDPVPIIESKNGAILDDLAAEALTTVFGMDAEGRIKKEKARHVVENLGLIGKSEDDKHGFELLGNSEEELRVEEVVGEMDEDTLRRMELLQRAFTVFDEDGDGFIEALEVKRVLECLGLGNGWDMNEIEKMVEVVDLNFDGKVDFTEFKLMMGEKF